jgi:predicted TIM-barrel fold metal-dependent hydrolase
VTKRPLSEWLISVDDHVVEPPRVWLDRLPRKYHDRCPQMAKGERGAVWRYEDKVTPTAGLAVTAGKRKEDFSIAPVTFDEMRPGAYDPVARAEDMDRAGILASLGFPTFPGHCGGTFHAAKDKELALLCVQAYNDWMIDEWCAAVPGRYIPLALIPLWDPKAAAVEIERSAAKGARGISFSENPEPLGLPTIHDPGRYWDPVMAAAADAEMVLCMHVGSSGTMPPISSNAPVVANLTFGAVRPAGAMLSWLFSDYFERFPRLKIALSEGNIGWIPYFLERAEQVRDKQRHWAAVKNTQFYKGTGGSQEVAMVPQANLEALDIRKTFREHIYGCFIDEASGIRCLDMIGEDNVMVEVDYPHSDTSWPDSIEIANGLLAHLPEATRRKILRGNAEKLFRFTPALPSAATA